MRALRWYGREDLRLEDGTEPSADPGQVVIEVRWCGICGTDLHEYLKGPIFVPTEPHPVSGIAAPLTLGHEFTGRIRRAGRRVKWLKVGDRATVDAALKCGHCRYCLSGQYIRCESRGSWDWRPTGAWPLRLGPGVHRARAS
jgi:(R,R)-butanediol dehydrogenase / meso-butanediol dehydrogenase / diacetyl reductase